MRHLILLLVTTALVLPAAEGSAQPGAHRGQLRQHLLQKFDADQDGKLSETERQAARAACQERRAAGKAKFDADQDGKLSETERAAARAAISAKIKEKHPELFKRIDTDGDGVISRDEGQAARQHLRERRQQRRGQHGE